MDLTGSYTSLNFNNPLVYLCGSTLCYIVTGVTILVSGVIITSVSFQNLESYHQGNKERFAGPILIGVGILVMGKGAVIRLKDTECRALNNVWKRLRRRLVISLLACTPMYAIVLSGSNQIPLRQQGARMADNLATLTRSSRWNFSGSDSKLFMDRVLKSTLCNLFLGGSLLLAGVLVTASTLHGDSDNNVHGHLFVVGPILLVAGMFGLSRVMFKRAKTQHRRRRGRRRLREEQRPPGGDTDERIPSERQSSSDTAIFLEPTDFGDYSYDDNPPPYEVVANDRSYLVSGSQTSCSGLRVHGGAMDNPALEDDIGRATMVPPPSYEEVINMQGAAFYPQSASRPRLDSSDTSLAVAADPDSGCSSGSHFSSTVDSSSVQDREPEATPGLPNLDTIQQTQV